MINKRHGLTIIYALISLLCFLMAFVFIKKTSGMSIDAKIIFICAVSIPFLLMIFSFFTYDFFLEGESLVLKSDIKNKRIFIRDLDINGIQVFGRPYFIISLNNKNFWVNYTTENFNVLKLVLKNCKSSKISEQKIKQIEKKLLHPF